MTHRPLKRFDQDQGYSRDLVSKPDGINDHVRLPGGGMRRVVGRAMTTESGVVRETGVIFEAQAGDTGFGDYVLP